MSDSLHDALADPQFDALTIQLVQPAEGDPARAAGEALNAAVAEVLGTTAAGWSVTAVHEMAPGAYDLFAPPGAEISVAQAFDLTYALQAHRAVETADVLFETNLDNVPESVELRAGPPGLESLGVDWFGDLSEAERNPHWSLQQIRSAISMMATTMRRTHRIAGAIMA